MGLLGGYSLNFMTGSRYSLSRSHPIFETEYLGPFLLGSSFLVAGIACKYGDRLWLGRTSQALQPKAYSLSQLQFWLSVGLIVFGGGLIMSAVILQIIDPENVR